MLRRIMAHCPSLRALQVSQTEVTDAGIAFLAIHHPFQLEHLGIAYCDHITDTGLLSIARHMLLPAQRKLVFIDVSGCYFIRTPGLVTLVTAARRNLELYDEQEGNREARRLGLRDHRHIRIDFEDCHGKISRVDRRELLGVRGSVSDSIWVCCPGKVW
eukprot:TRINITY_DN13563_c0_g2_i4.p1 TRINITY_DN13563_c0_g2~~TRINITY_DN13563_c0_g2_i4.p1  ORF type:complete len:159 (-),score=9.62 TRINITY_DN13563_c0_g2_i4:3-479(-)